MGNRAVIINDYMPNVGIYLHWNGGLESVLAFIAVTKHRGARTPQEDPTYSFARLIQTICDFFGPGNTSIGVGPIEMLDCDNRDNGVFYVGNNWRIVRREFNGSDKRKTVKSLTPDERAKYDAIVIQLTEPAEEAA